jgi:hypothetical protein
VGLQNEWAKGLHKRLIIVTVHRSLWYPPFWILFKYSLMFQRKTLPSTRGTSSSRRHINTVVIHIAMIFKFSKVTHLPTFKQCQSHQWKVWI